MVASRDPSLDGRQGGKKPTIVCGDDDDVSEKGLVIPRDGLGGTLVNRGVKGYGAANAYEDDAVLHGR